MNVLREANQTVPEELTKYGSHVKKKEHGLYGAFFKVRRCFQSSNLFLGSEHNSKS